MVLRGNIIISRRLREHAIWQRPDYGWAWVDLLMLANNRDGTKHLNGEFVDVKRGQLLWSLRSLEKEWNKSGEWLTGFLKFCKDQNMVKIDSNRRRTIITVLNYEAYNPSVTETETDTETVSVTETETDTLTEQKGERRKEKEKGERATPPKKPENEGFSELPNESEILSFAEGYAGDLARGIPAHFPPRWSSDWLRYKLANPATFPKKWREKMLSDFVSDFVSGHPKARGVELGGKKNGAAGTRSPAQARFEMSRELEELQVKLDACHENDVAPNPRDKAREKELIKALMEFPK